MAVFLSDRPFRGARETMYEFLLQSNPDYVRMARKVDFEEFLKKKEQDMLDRTSELQRGYEAQLGCGPSLAVEDWMENQKRCETALAMARRRALDETLMELSAL
ncbi:MAG: hypothetical protein SOU51_01135 [Collinsella sp.]|nr:hypothetical protein [Collinsella sp.]